MDDESQDQGQFFKDFGATAEQTVQEVRGFEKNYYSLVQRTMPALPLLANFNKKLQSYITQNFAAAYEFTRELSQAKNMQDFIRIQTDYIQKCGHSFAAQMRDFTETYCNMASSAIKAPSISSSEAKAPLL
jgi:Phasin protein